MSAVIGFNFIHTNDVAVVGMAPGIAHGTTTVSGKSNRANTATATVCNSNILHEIFDYLINLNAFAEELRR